MALFASPEIHNANHPQTWQVVKLANRRWAVATADWSEGTGGAPLETHATKRAAQESRQDGWAARLWDKERRWFAGESIPGWKSYAEVTAENARTAERMAERAAANALEEPAPVEKTAPARENMLLTDARILVRDGWNYRRILDSMADLAAELSLGYCTPAEAEHARRVLGRLAMLEAVLLSEGTNQKGGALDVVSHVFGLFEGRVPAADREPLEGHKVPEKTDVAEPDERIQAWHQIASHPFFAECYPAKEPLIVTMLAKLDRVHEYLTALDAPQPAIQADFWDDRTTTEGSN